MTIAPIASAPDLVKYRLLDEIGHGGMATVYRAMDVRLGREVAVKLMHPHLRDNREAAARFVAEARAVAKLKHHGIVEIFDVSDEEDNERFLVAELVRGPSLRRVLHERPEVPVEIGACFGVLLCDALAHAHDNGIIHRDVKPENVLVEINESRKTANVKLTDFGIAKVLDAQGVTSTGQVLGSPAHMAPEQIEGGAVDARTDIFSLGVLVYECMVGHLPFEGKNPAQVLRRVLEGSYKAPDAERPKVGARWAALLARAIANDPSQRYGDVREFAAALRRELEAMGIVHARAEVFAYLAGATAYVEAFTPRLVQALVARAQKAREANDVHAAAADLNRAVAYAPGDTELLALVMELATGAKRHKLRRRATKAAAALVSFAVLGALAFVVVRALRVESPAPLGSVAPAQPVPEPPRPEVSVTPVAVVSASPTREPPVATVSARPTAQPAVAAPMRTSKPVVEQQVDRRVRILATPQSALVSVDGDGPTAVSFGVERRLSTGTHTFAFTVPEGNPCCRPQSYSVTIEPDPADKPYTVHGILPFREARVALVGGPGDAKLDCPAVNVSIGTGAIASVPMTSPDRPVACWVRGSGIPTLEKRGNLQPGQTFVVTAPRP